MPADLSAELLAITSGLRRALRRRLGRVAGVSELTDAQRELVRVVRRQPGVRVGEAARQMHLAGNTVSTMVAALSGSGWILREADPADARSARLRLTDEANAKVARWRDRRVAEMERSLGELSVEDRRQIDAAIPALTRLLQIVKVAT